MSDNYPAGIKDYSGTWEPTVKSRTYQPGVATCADCGGKYRPAGGPCIHEHPAPGWGKPPCEVQSRRQGQPLPDPLGEVAYLREELDKCRARIVELEAEMAAHLLQDLADATQAEYQREES